MTTINDLTTDELPEVEKVETNVTQQQPQLDLQTQINMKILEQLQTMNTKLDMLGNNLTQMHNSSSPNEVNMRGSGMFYARADGYALSQISSEKQNELRALAAMINQMNGY